MILPIKKIRFPKLTDIHSDTPQTFISDSSEMPEAEHQSIYTSEYFECFPEEMAKKLPAINIPIWSYQLLDRMVFTTQIIQENYQTFSRFSTKTNMIELRICSCVKLIEQCDGFESTWPAGSCIHLSYTPAGKIRTMDADIYTGQFFYLAFEPEFIESELGLCSKDLPNIFEQILNHPEKQQTASFPTTPDTEKSMSELTSILQEKGSSSLSRFNKILDFFQLALADIKRQDSDNENTPQLNKKEQGKIIEIKNAIDADITQRLTADDLTRLTGLNRNKLRLGFRSFYNLSIAEYYTQQRMVLAKNLLQKGELQISQIADKVGYSEAASFSRVFKKYYGYPPTNAS